MIEYQTGDILASDAEALVNTVNCVGVMGRGIALQFKNAFPENFKAYEKACKLEQVQPGHMFIVENNKLNQPRYIVNFPTKRHWKGKSRMEDIDAGLIALAWEINQRGIKSIAVPPLGSGLGGLVWSEVRPRIEAALGNISSLKVVIYEPTETSDSRQITSSKTVPSMTPGSAALVVLMDRYLSGLLDPFVTLLEVHKLMYFMQEAGQPLGLKYVQGHYGPYAEKLRHVLNHVEGHMISGYADGGDAPNKQLALIPGAIDKADSFIRNDIEVRNKLDRVTDLVEGFETPFGLELLSTVHWVSTKMGATTEDEAIERTYGWSDHKKQFSPRQIALALQVLAAKGWVEPRPLQDVIASTTHISSSGIAGTMIANHPDIQRQTIRNVVLTVWRYMFNWARRF